MNGYYIFFENTDSSGVEKKINMQIAEMAKYSEVELVTVPKLSRNLIKRIWGLLLWTSNQYDYEQLFNKLVSPDFLYIRYVRSDRKAIRFYKKVKEHYPKCKIVVEIPTYPNDRECWWSINYLFLLKDRYYRGKLKRYVERFVTFSTDEVIWGVPTIRVLNGIDVDAEKMVQGCLKDSVIRLGTVAFLNKSHGYERWIKGLAKYYQGNFNIIVEIHIIGDGAALSYYKKFVRRYQMENYVIFYGKKEGKELDEIYNNIDIALGAFGAYKERIFRASSLKIREYLAKGLPVISGCKEDVFEDVPGFPYYLEMRNDDSIINIDDVLHFYDKIYHNGISRQDVRNEIRNFAKEKVDISVTMIPVINYIKDKRC